MDLLPDYLTGIALLVCCTAFIKALTVFSILRFGLGLTDFVFGLVIVVVAVVFGTLANPGLSHEISSSSTFNVEAEKEREFFVANSDKDILSQVQTVAKKISSSKVADSTKNVEGEPAAEEQTQQASSVAIETVITAFLLTELQEAFYLGMLLLIPLVVIDLLVVNVLAVLGITQISAIVIALPLKILLFVSVNGWQLLAEKLLNSYS